MPMCKTADTLKLINEVLIFDELWQESVKAFSISIFLSDIASSIPGWHSVNYLDTTDLSGTNILNFDESSFL